MNLFPRFMSLAVLTLFVLVPITFAQASLADVDIPYTQDFDTLVTNSPPPTKEPLFANEIEGWYSNRATYLPDNGNSTSGSLYSYGSPSASTERALGSVSTSNTAGPVPPAIPIYYGIRLKNDTGAMISSIDVMFTGEQWRKAANASTHYLRFDYRQAPEITDLTSGKYTSVAALDFASPIKNALAATFLNGNLDANRTFKSANIIVSLPAGQEIMLRWTDNFDTGANHGLAIDDLSVTPRLAPVAANASLGGRILTSNGRGIRNAHVVISGNNLQEPARAVTGPFGYYNFEDLTVGETYIVTVNSKRFSFKAPSRVVNLIDQIADADFVAEP